MAKDNKTKEELEAELKEIKEHIESEEAEEPKEEPKEKEVPEIESPEKKEIEIPTVVVSELPQVQTRTGYIGDQEVKLITPDEAMTEMYNSIKAMRVAIG